MTLNYDESLSYGVFLVTVDETATPDSCLSPAGKGLGVFVTYCLAPGIAEPFLMRYTRTWGIFTSGLVDRSLLISGSSIPSPLTKRFSSKLLIVDDLSAIPL